MHGFKACAVPQPPLSPPLYDVLEGLDALDTLLVNCSDAEDIDELLRDVDGAVALMAAPPTDAQSPPHQSLRDLADEAAVSATTPVQLFNAVCACLDLELHTATTPPSSPSSYGSASASPSTSCDLRAPAADLAAADRASCLLAAADWRPLRLARPPVAGPAPAASDGAWALGARAITTPLLRSSPLASSAALPAWAAPHDARARKRSLSDPTGGGRSRSSKQPRHGDGSNEGTAVGLDRKMQRELSHKSQLRRLAQERLALLQQQPPAVMDASSCWQGAWMAGPLAAAAAGAAQLVLRATA